MSVDNKTLYNEFCKCRSNPLLFSLHSQGSFRSTMTKTWADGSVYQNSNILLNPTDLRKNKNDMKKLIHLQKAKRINAFGGLHLKLLKESFANNFKSTYITDNSSKQSVIVQIQAEDKTVDKNYLTKADFKSRNPTNYLLKSNNVSNNFSNNISAILKPIKVIDKIKSEKTPIVHNTIHKFINEKKESNSNFLENIRNVSRTQFLIGFKKEHAVRLQEDCDNETGEVKEEIGTSKEFGTLLVHTIDDKFNKYLNHLIIHKEQAKTELEKLIFKQHIIDLEMKKINHSISKLRNNFDKFVDYRNFLICVKERLINLPKHFLLSVYEDTQYDKFNNLVIDKKHISISSSSVFNKRASMYYPKRNANKFTSDDFQIKESLALEMKRFSLYLLNPVYNSPEEFIQDYSNLEKHNLELLRNYNENNQIIFERNDNINIHNLYTSNILICEEKLAEMILLNKNLIDERNTLQNDIKEKSEGPLNKYNTKDELNSKINEVYRNIIQILPPSFYDNNYLLNSVNDKFNIENNSEKLKSREIEKILSLLQLKYNGYKNNKETWKKLIELEIRSEKERKHFKSLQLKLKGDLKRQELQKEVSEKENDFVILPRRKVIGRYKPCKRKRKNKMETEGQKDDEFDRFINYEDN